MAPGASADQSDPTMTFVIRLQRAGGGLRGQVVSVTTGATRLFEGLADAVAFIEAAAREGDLSRAEGRNAQPHAVMRCQELHIPKAARRR